MQLLTRPEVAKTLKVSERTVYSLTASGRLPAVKLDKSIRYRMQDVEAFVTSNLTSVITQPSNN